ncbi:MAG: hypothetical protein MI741_20195, partial [Rhodospirillales bacterium]|nr:hypothetical protein [Rhodospirillales bacterium]
MTTLKVFRSGKVGIGFIWLIIGLCLTLCLMPAGLVRPAAADDDNSKKISFQNDVPVRYQQGSGFDIYFNLLGELPESADVVVTGWSDAEQDVIDPFAHRITESPWKISSEYLDKLPIGHNKLTLLYREDGQTIDKDELWIVIFPKSTNTIDDALLDFTPQTQVTYRQKSGVEVPFLVLSEMPDGADVEVRFWSYNDKGYIEDATHQLSDAPWKVDNEILDEMEPGLVNVQISYRMQGQELDKISLNLL